MTEIVHRAGTVALVGRPNAGKSTLMNRILEERLSIVSDKPQTTRNRMIGILSRPEGQIVFFDTPGMHRPMHRLNREMVREANDALAEADVVCLIFREEMYKLGDEPSENDGVAEIIIAKQRNGPTGTIKLAFLREQTRFANLAQGAGAVDS